MMDFLKKIGKQQEPEDLDTGYDSDYYGGAYGRQPAQDRPNESDGDERFDDRYERDLYNRDRASYDEDNRFYRDTYVQPEPTPAAAEPETPAAPANAGTLYYTPETYRDCREAIVSGLAESHVVVVNVKNLQVADTVRLFDYIMGAVLALEADMTRLNQSMLLLAPKGVEVTEDDLRSLFAPKETVARTAPSAETESSVETADEDEDEDLPEDDDSEGTEDDFMDYEDLSDEDLSI